jgi:predicted lipoprotein
MKKTLLIAAVGLALAAAPMAHADTDSTFVQTLVNGGYPINGESAQALVQDAHEVCGWPRNVDNAAAVFADRHGGWSREQAKQFVILAQKTYCPS